MEHSGKKTNSAQDDNRLADFTDQVIAGKLEQVESNVDDDLLGLEETILRLKRTLPSTELDQAAVKQMQVRLNARIKREALQAQPPFWKQWADALFRPQFGMAFAAVLVLVALVVFFPSSTGTGGPLTGTAMAPASAKGLLIASVFAVMILAFAWMKRPK